MSAFLSRLERTARAAAAAAALILPLQAATVVLAPPAHADLASDKAAVDAAKRAGRVGEQGDGFLGFVNGGADAATTAAVSAINAGRTKVYAETAARTGVTVQAAGEAAGTQLLSRVPPGQFYKPLGGGWTKR